MKKRIISGIACLAMMVSVLAGCGGSSSSTAASTAETKAAETEAAAGETEAAGEAASDEVTLVKIGYVPTSGHVLSGISEDQGYYEEEGISVEYVTFANNDDAMSSLTSGKVDMLSTYGTNMPLAMIAKGENVTIISGYMLTGAMTYACREDEEFTGVESFIGKKIACPGLVAHQLTYPILEAGYDPTKDVEMVQLASTSERIEAVASGKADFAMLATGMDTTAKEAGLKIACYNSDLMPEYSCCRGVINSDFIKNNPTTTKKLLKCWIRSLQLFESDREAWVSFMANQIDMDEDYVSHYLLDDHYQLQVDPAYSIVKRAWDVDKQVGVIEADDSLLEEHFDASFYKAALDEVIAEHYDEDPEFYDACTKYYEENDL